MSKTSVKSGGSIFDEMLGDISYSKDSSAGKLFPFFVRVGCVRRRPPRHEGWEFIREMGAAVLPRVFTGEALEQANLAFVFPERHLGVAEQYAFTSALANHPDVGEIEQVDIITSSPMIVGSFLKEQVRILSWPDDDKYCGGIGNTKNTPP